MFVEGVAALAFDYIADDALIIQKDAMRANSIECFLADAAIYSCRVAHPTCDSVPFGDGKNRLGLGLHQQESIYINNIDQRQLPIFNYFAFIIMKLKIGKIGFSLFVCWILASSWKILALVSIFWVIDLIWDYCSSSKLLEQSLTKLEKISVNTWNNYQNQIFLIIETIKYDKLIEGKYQFNTNTNLIRQIEKDAINEKTKRFKKHKNMQKLIELYNIILKNCTIIYQSFKHLSFLSFYSSKYQMWIDKQAKKLNQIVNLRLTQVFILKKLFQTLFNFILALIQNIVLVSKFQNTSLLQKLVIISCANSIIRIQDQLNQFTISTKISHQSQATGSMKSIELFLLNDKSISIQEINLILQKEFSNLFENKTEQYPEKQVKGCILINGSEKNSIQNQVKSQNSSNFDQKISRSQFIKELNDLILKGITKRKEQKYERISIPFKLTHNQEQNMNIFELQ